MGRKSSISCDKYQDMIYDYFSDCLGEEQIEQLENHISSCLTCKKEFEQLRALLSSAEQMNDQPLPVGYTTSLHAKLAEASLEIQDRRAHKFKYFCKDFITDGKWKVAAPAVVAVALLVGVFSTGLFQDFIHTDDGMITDNIESSQNAQNHHSEGEDFGLGIDGEATARPKTTLRPKASSSPTANTSNPRSTARATSKATSRATSKTNSGNGSSSSSNARSRATATAKRSTGSSSGTSATKQPTSAPTEQKNYPEIAFNDSAQKANTDENTENYQVNESYEEPKNRVVEKENTVADTPAPILADSPQNENSGDGKSANDLVSGMEQKETSTYQLDENGQYTVYYVHHDDPEAFIKEYGFSNFSVDKDGDYHVYMPYQDFVPFVDYADEHQMKLKWLNNGDNGMVELVITKSELKDEEIIAD